MTRDAQSDQARSAIVVTISAAPSEKLIADNAHSFPSHELQRIYQLPEL